MNCPCHDAPAYWQKDKRLTAGGWWECSVKRTQRERDRYDRDPIFRIEKRLHDDARRRGATLKRRREALGGSLPFEGHHGFALEQHSAQDHKAA